MRRVRLEPLALVTLEDVEGRQASKLLELFGVIIDGRRGHLSGVRLQHLWKGLSRDDAARDHDHEGAYNGQ